MHLREVATFNDSIDEHQETKARRPHRTHAPRRCLPKRFGCALGLSFAVAYSALPSAARADNICWELIEPIWIPPTPLDAVECLARNAPLCLFLPHCCGPTCRLHPECILGGTFVDGHWQTVECDVLEPEEILERFVRGTLRPTDDFVQPLRSIAEIQVLGLEASGTPIPGHIRALLLALLQHRELTGLPAFRAGDIDRAVMQPERAPSAGIYLTNATEAITLDNLIILRNLPYDALLNEPVRTLEDVLCGRASPEFTSALALLAHELVHVRQWDDLGRDSFFNNYILEVLAAGYGNDTFESEAFALGDAMAALLSSPFDSEQCLLRGDFNGDRRDDIAVWQLSSSNWAMNLSAGYGFRTPTWTGAWGSDGAPQVGDFNGDGKDDIIMWRAALRDWTVNLSTGSNFNFQVWGGAWGSDGPIFVGDFNGDGRDDIMMWRAALRDWTVNLSTGTNFNFQVWGGAWGSDGPIFVGDFNGDGRDDIMMWRATLRDWTVNLSTGSGFNFQIWRGAPGSDGPIFVGDFNGDRKKDVIMWRGANNDWTVNLSTGTGFISSVWNGAYGSDGPIHVGDFDGNGKDDVIMWREARNDWTVNLSTGSNFNFQVWGGAFGSDGPIVIGNFDGRPGPDDVLMRRTALDDWTVNLSARSGFNWYVW